MSEDQAWGGWEEARDERGADQTVVDHLSLPAGCLEAFPGVAFLEHCLVAGPRGRPPAFSTLPRCAAGCTSSEQGEGWEVPAHWRMCTKEALGGW